MLITGEGFELVPVLFAGVNLGDCAELFNLFRFAALTSVVSFTFCAFGFVADAHGFLNGRPDGKVLLLGLLVCDLVVSKGLGENLLVLGCGSPPNMNVAD